MTTVGERIKTRRLELGWTQETLAEKAGISKGFLSDLENGKRSVSAENLLEIAAVLGLSLDFLMKGEVSASFQSVDVQIPAALSEFAAQEGLTFKQTLTLLQMRRQILAHRSSSTLSGESDFDWRKLYESVRDFIK